jgi:hypothetical protein
MHSEGQIQIPLQQHQEVNPLRQLLLSSTYAIKILWAHRQHQVNRFPVYEEHLSTILLHQLGQYRWILRSSLVQSRLILQRLR